MPNPSDLKAKSTTSTELLDTLTQRAQERTSRAEFSLAQIQQTVSGCASSLNESAKQFRRDMAEEVRQERQLQRRWLTWGPLALIGSGLLTVGLCVWLTWWLIDRGTTSAFGSLQQQAATQVAELRSQAEVLKLELQTAKAELTAARALTEQKSREASGQQQRLDELLSKIEQAQQQSLAIPAPTDPRWIKIEPLLGAKADGSLFIQLSTPLQFQQHKDPAKTWVKIP